MNAAGGSDPLQLEVSVGGQSTSAGGSLGFGEVGEYVDVSAGDAELRVEGADATESLRDGRRYTVVAVRRGSDGLSLQTLRTRRGTAGEARLRVVHAAPELGSPDIRIGRRTVAQGVEFRSATPYLTLDPGSYRLAVTKPDGGDAVFTERISLAAGSASTVIVAGSGGSAARAIMVDDGSLTPAGAPETGLGGLAEGGGAPWALALLAALAAGALGGAAHLTRTRRARP